MSAQRTESHDTLPAYLARHKSGAECHFGCPVLARAWAGADGAVIERPVRTLALVDQSPERAAYDAWYAAATFETMGHEWTWAAWQAATAQQAAEVQRLRAELDAAHTDLNTYEVAIKDAVAAERERITRNVADALEDAGKRTKSLAASMLIFEAAAEIRRAARQDGAGEQG